MAHELFEQNRRRRNFWTSEGNLPGATDYQPSPSGYPSLVRAPGVGQPPEQAPAPTPNYPPPPQPPEMEPVSRGRRIGAAFAAFAARFGGEPGAGTRVGEQITGAPYRQKMEEYRRQYGDWKSQGEYGEAQEERGRARAGETRAQEAHGRYESPGDEQTRRAQEAEAQGLTGEAAQRYTLTGRMAQPDRPDTSLTAIEWADQQAQAEGFKEGTPEYADRVTKLVRAGRPPTVQITPGQQVNLEQWVARQVDEIGKDEALLQSNPYEARRRGITAESIAARKQRLQQQVNQQRGIYKQGGRDLFPSGPSTSPTQGGEDEFGVFGPKQ